MNIIFKIAALIAAALTLSCGGGGSGGGGVGGSILNSQPVQSGPISGVAPKFWGTPIKLSVNQPPEQLVQLDDGTTLMLDSHSPVTLRRVNASGEIIENLEITNGSEHLAYAPTIRSDKKGGVFIAWLQDDQLISGIHVRTYDKTAGLGPVALLKTGTKGRSFGFYDLAVRIDGSAIIAWSYQEDGLILTTPIPESQDYVYVSEYTPSMGWSIGEPISDRKNYLISQITIGTSSNGHSVVLWSQPVGNDNLFSTLAAAYKPANGSWQKPTLVALDTSAPPISNTSFFYLNLVVSTSGAVNVTWQINGSGIGFNRYEPNNGWLGEIKVSDTGSLPLIAMNSKDEGFLAWSESGLALPVTLKFNESGWLGKPNVVVEDSSSEIKGAGLLSLLVDESSKAVMVFGSTIGGNAIGAHLVLRGSIYSPDTGWSTPVAFPPKSDLAYYFTASPFMNGKTTFTWLRAPVNIVPGDTGGVMFLNFSIP
jgi:hypothetical protein